MTKLVSVQPHEMTGARLGVLIAFAVTMFFAVVWVTILMFNKHPYVMAALLFVLFVVGTYFYIDAEYNIPLYRGKR